MTDGVRLTAADRASGALVRLVAKLPPSLQDRLAGGPRIEAGVQLLPEVNLILRLIQLVPQPSERDVLRMRRETLTSAALFGGRPLPVHSVRDTVVPFDGREIPARLYSPAPGTPGPLVVYTHGGGWVCGGLDSADSICRFLSHHAGVSVLSVSYRLAPEHPYPAATDDAYAAYRYVRLHPELFGADPDRIVVAGDSAGGTLAAVTAQRAKQDGFPSPAAQLLLYPVLDASAKSPSYRLFSDGFLLTEEELDWCFDQYLPQVPDRLEPWASPLLSGDLSQLPPALIAVAGFDILRDEGIAYADALRRAGVAVRLQVHERLIHAFANTTGIGRSGTAAMLQVTTALRELLAEPGQLANVAR